MFCCENVTIDVPEQISLGFPNEALGSCRNRVGDPMAYRDWEEYHLSRSKRLHVPQTGVDAWGEIIKSKFIGHVPRFADVIAGAGKCLCFFLPTVQLYIAIIII